MKQNFTKLLIFVLFSLPVSVVFGQVTIGADISPQKGALLDLKEKTPTVAGDATTTKGLGLPRVELKDMNKLIMGNYEVLDSQDGGGQYKKHTGLIVYNISGAAIPNCAAIPNGIYVWNGTTWKGVNTPKSNLASLTVSGSDIYFPSGQDLRTLSTPETIFLNWSPSSVSVAYTNTPHATWGGISFDAVHTLPANSNLTTSPNVFSLLPNAMTDAEVSANPFRTKENTLKFTINQVECGKTITEIRILNQTNKALIIKEPLKEHTPTVISHIFTETNVLTANANWKLVSNEPAGLTTISNVKLDGNLISLGSTYTGFEQNNNEGKQANLTYNVESNVSKARYSFLTFADASTPKRFADVTLAVMQCSNIGSLPTIEGWALISGFTQAEIDKVKQTGVDSRILPNGLQMHRQVSSIRGANQIFLSSNFGASPTGSDQRWMVHNLDAIDYDGVTHSASRVPSGPNGNPKTSLFSDPPVNTAYWAYPKANGVINTNEAKSSELRDNECLGLYYTWDAATAGKGGVDGTAVSKEGHNVISKVQGICPKGWHLPSLKEWDLLGDDTVANSKLFSSYIGPVATNTYLGTTWKDTCLDPFTANGKGTSNPLFLPYRRPGLNVYLAGFAALGSTTSFGAMEQFWTASSASNTYAQIVALNHNNGIVDFNTASRRGLMGTIRCKKD